MWSQPPGPPDSRVGGAPVGLDFTSLFWTTFHNHFEVTKIIKTTLAPRREHRFHKIAGLIFQSIFGPILGSKIIGFFEPCWVWSPKTAPRGPKTAPRGAQEALRRFQECSKRPHDGSKRAPRALQEAS